LLKVLGPFTLCPDATREIAAGTTRPEERISFMAETAQQYIQRIIGNINGQDPVKVQATTAKKLERLVKGVSLSRLRKRPAPDKWSVTEIVAHLADAEIVIAWRMRAILGAPGTPIQAYDQDAWVRAGHYEKRHPRKCVEQFRVVREANLGLLKSLTPEQWKHHGLHAERGQETVEHIVQLIAGHDINHLRQIECLLTPKKS
jgi:DinB superfamily